MKRMNRHLISGMATVGIALSACGLGLPIHTQPLSSVPTLNLAPTPIAPESVNTLLWTPGRNLSPGLDRNVIGPTATIEIMSNT